MYAYMWKALRHIFSTPGYIYEKSIRIQHTPVTTHRGYIKMMGVRILGFSDWKNGREKNFKTEN